MADAESIKRWLKEEHIPKALWPRTGKIKHILIWEILGSAQMVEAHIGCYRRCLDICTEGDI